MRSALRSVGTRREAATTKVERIEPALSALRREFSERCSLDAEKAARAAIATAGTALGSVERLAGQGDWDDAADAVATARTELGRAEERQ
ncbi:MAG: hypothetical protein L0I24_12880, partial [Pseudonocardia sp.]|nr:hypothetical protein [Pseudonocardia sp.]